MADELTSRLAARADVETLRSLMHAAIGQLLPGFLPPEAVVASFEVMGLDTQLIDDGTYFVVECGGTLAGCGGWSRRATLYGGDHSAALRDARLLDPAHDAARVRAMFTDPAFARRGVGRLILSLCEDAARAAGFTRAEMMATLAGEPLYAACGYVAIDRVSATPVDGVAVPLVRMEKGLS